MIVYLASWFASKDQMKVRAEALRSAGIEVTSRWLEERVSPTTSIQDISDAYLRETGQVDIHDILTADTVILNIPSQSDFDSINMPVANWARGGRHFEAGFQYATMMFQKFLPDCIQNRGHRRLILIGHKENVFHYLDGTDKEMLADGFPLPGIELYTTWEEAFNALTKEGLHAKVAGE